MYGPVCHKPGRKVGMDFDTIFLEIMDKFSTGKTTTDIKDYCAVYPQYKERILHKLQAMQFIKNNLQQEENFSGRSFGEYNILQELGRGGMGIVFLAIQPLLSRLAAIKVLPPAFVSDEQSRQNFKKEATIIAKFNHPNIVSVYSFGNEQGVYYIAMGYVPGPSLKGIIENLSSMKPQGNFKAAILKDIIQASPAGQKENSQQSTALTRSPEFWEKPYYEFAATIGLEISQALSYAHRKGIFHGDIKPANILFSPASIPLLVDFGLARDSRKLSDSQSKEFSGTLLYAAPEQLEQNIINAKTDIWSMGVTLYELLTFNLPFRGSSLQEIADKIRKMPPVFLRYYNKNIPVELEAIVLKCLENKPEKRYDCVEELSGDLQNYLQAKPITARPAGILVRANKWIIRNPYVAAWIVITIFSGLTVSFLLFNKRIQGLVKSGTSSLDSAHYTNAIKDYTQAIRLLDYLPFRNGTRRKEILKGLGKSWRGKGNFEEAIRCLKEVIKIDPAYVPGIGYLGDTYLEKGLYDEAIECYKTALAISPSDRYNWYYLGEALANKGLWDEAVGSYLKAVTIAPEDVEHLKKIASLLPKMNLSKDAEITAYLTNKGFPSSQVEAILHFFPQSAPE